MTMGMLPKFSASQKYKWVKQKLPVGLRVGETIVLGEGAALNFWEWLPCVRGAAALQLQPTLVTGVLAQYCQILKLFF